jgi:hypothetical protein
VPPADTSTAPFLVELQRRDMARAGRFVPGARLILQPALRSSGLLSALPDAEAARTLLFLLTFLTPNGDVRTSLPELAQAMGLSENKARARMERLITLVWRGQPVVREVQHELGADTYTLSPHLLAVREAAGAPAAERTLPAYRAAGREAVVARSRAEHATPRAEAERMVLEQLGHRPPEPGPDPSSPEGAALNRLLAVGVSHAVALHLVRDYPIGEVSAQLDWLPYRAAKNPARLVVAAIENDYDAPAATAARRRRLQTEPEPGQEPNTPDTGGEHGGEHA